jgi:hypothetical protein
LVEDEGGLTRRKVVNYYIMVFERLAIESRRSSRFATSVRDFRTRNRLIFLMFSAKMIVFSTDIFY